MDYSHKYTELIDKVFNSVENIENKEFVFTTETGNKYKFYDDKECCASIYIEDIIGNLDDLVGSPIIMAEEIIYKDEPPKDCEILESEGSFTWTFYKFATIKGYVTVRWYGMSNGHYSESVDFTVCNEK